MYTYIKAFGVKALDPVGLEPLDITDIKTKDFREAFVKLLIVIEDGLTDTTGTINADDHYESLSSFDGYIQEWLDAQQNTVLRIEETIPNDDYVYVTSGDLQYKWFSLYPGDIYLADDKQEQLTTSSAPDIRVKRTDNQRINYQNLIDYCLFTVNGHLVRAALGNDEIYLLNGGKHFRVNDNIHVTYLNFNNISKLSTYEINEEDLNITESEEGYVYLRYKSPVETTNKKVFMSIMGRLFINDVVKPMGNNTFNIKVGKVDWFTAFFDSKEMIDLSELGSKELSVINNRFFNKDFFTKLLTDPSSFLIVLDNPDVHAYTKPVTMYNYPFTYHTTETRPLPLVTSGGLLPKYFVRKIGHRRLLDTDIGVQRVYLSKTAGTNNGTNILHNYTNRFISSELSRGYQLYIRGLRQP